MDKAQTEVADAIRKVWPDVNPAMAFSYAGIAIACLQKRWTSEAAVVRALTADADLHGQAHLRVLLTAAMRDE